MDINYNNITGERMTRLYSLAVLYKGTSNTPEFENSDEQAYYNKIKQEIENNKNKNTVWNIPNE